MDTYDKLRILPIIKFSWLNSCYWLKLAKIDVKYFSSKNPICISVLKYFIAKEIIHTVVLQDIIRHHFTKLLHSNDTWLIHIAEVHYCYMIIEWFIMKFESFIWSCDKYIQILRKILHVGFKHLKIVKNIIGVDIVIKICLTEDIWVNLI